MKTLTEAVKACGGVWPSKSIPNGYLQDFLSPRVFTVAGIKPPEYICSRAEFEAEAARLSGKPGWVEAPEWAEWLAQDNDGKWHFYINEPEVLNRIWQSDWPRIVPKTLYGEGTVLGNWRDTLERRPEASAEPEAESPPVGWYGEVTYGTRACWRTCVMLPDGFAAVELDDRWVISKVDNWDFRELDHDRDDWVQAALKQDCPASEGMLSRMDFCAALYDALKSGELPMPE